MSNILEIAKSYLNASNEEKLAGQLNEDATAVHRGLHIILPSVLGVLVQKASTTHGAEEIYKYVKDYEESSLLTLTSLPEILNNPEKFQKLLSTGRELLQDLLDDTLPKLSGKVAVDAGLKLSSSNSLVSIAASLLMNVLGSVVKSSGYGVSGLTLLLMGQKNAILATLPSEFSNLLNLKDLGDFKGSQETHPDYDEKKKSSWPIWLIVLLAIVGLFWILKTCRKDVTSTVHDTGVTLKSAKVAIGEAADSTAGKFKDGLEVLGSFFKRKLPNGVELNIPEFGIENKLVTFIEDKNAVVNKTNWFNFDRITFETGSNKLSVESLEQTKNIADILKAYPDVLLKIGGYTDNTGSVEINRKLSKERADAVKEAIMTEGITSPRLDAEGYGPDHPVASNDTEEGRAKNRRIAVRVIKK